MRLHRFFVEEKISGRAGASVVEPELVHQWRKVFRLKEGDSVILFDGSGSEYVCEIRELSRHGSELRVAEMCPVENVPKREVMLLPSLIKKDNLEWVVGKATELGVSAFAPILSERSEKRGFNAERARKIAKESSEQSGRGDVPEVHEAYPIRDALDALPATFIAFDPSAAPLDVSKLPNAPLGILIGPEGGWSEGELALFKAKSIPIYSTGPQILRAETAAIAISALLLL